MAGPEPVLKYLSRYTHRVAISNRRLVSMQDGAVRFRWRDRAHGNRQRLMQLDACELIRRFLLHVLPKRFVRIRHCGLLTNRVRRCKLALARRRIAEARGEATSRPDPEATTGWPEVTATADAGSGRQCRHAARPS